MTTTAIGGFSTHDASFGYFENLPGVFFVSSLFMFLAGINFTLHFFAWKERSLIKFFMDSEFKAYVTLLFVVIGFTLIVFGTDGAENQTQPGLLKIVFQVISIVTTTGYTSRLLSMSLLLYPSCLLYIAS